MANSSRFYLLLFLGAAALARTWLDLAGHASDEPFDGVSLLLIAWALTPYFALALFAAICRRGGVLVGRALFFAAIIAVSFDLGIAYHVIFAPTSSTSAVALLFLPPVTIGGAVLLWALVWAIIRFC